MNFDLRLGDCLDLMTDIADQSVDMILADLPYAVTRNSWDEIIPLEPLWDHYRRIAKENAAIVLTSQQPFSSSLVASNPSMFRYSLVWQKTMPTGFLNANRMPLRSHEDIMVFYRRLPTYNPQKTQGHKPYRTQTGKRTSNYGHYTQTESVSSGQRHPTSILKFNHERGLHPTQKPVALMEYLIRTYSDEGQTVLDNTMGSGTTGVAAMRSGRHFIGMERDPDYMQIALDRISDAQDLARVEQSKYRQ